MIKNLAPVVLLSFIVSLSGCTGHPDQNKTVEQYMESAAVYRNEGKLEEAVIETKNAIQIAPDNLKARSFLGELHLSLGDAASADKEFRRVQAGKGKPSMFMVKLGEALLRLGEWHEVLDRIQPDPSLSREDQARIHAQRGSAHIGLADTDAARKAFETAIELDKSCVPAWLGQVALVISDERYATARQLIKQAKKLAKGEDTAEAWRMTAELARLDGNYELAEASYTKAIELSAFKDTLRSSRSILRIEAGDYAGAHEDLNKLTEKLPGHPDVLYGKGLLAVREGRFSDARNYLEQHEHLIPNNINGIFYLGVANFGEGNIKDAEEYLTRVVIQSKNSLSAALLLGRARYLLGEHKAAAQVLEPLLLLQPDNSDLLSLLGNVYIAIGKTKHGSELLKSAITRRPEKSSDRLRLGLSLIKLGENSAAVKELEIVIANTQESDQAMVALMVGYIQTGKYKAARKIAFEIRDKRPDQAPPWNYIGMIEMAAGRSKEAHKAFEQALAIQPGLPTAGYNLAKIEEADGNIEEAKRIYKEILNKHPDHLRVLLKLASLEMNAGNSEYAQQLAEQAIKHHPIERVPRLWLARKYLSEGNTKKSLELFQEIEKHYRDDPDFLAVLGEAQLLAGETMAGMRTYKALSELTPKNADTQYMYARACAIHGDYLCLGDSLIEGLRLQPDHPALPTLVRRLIALSSSPDSTHKILWRLQVAAPGNLFLVKVRGEYALRTNRTRDAIRIYQKARKRFPDQWEWWGQLTYANARDGKLEDALADIRQWLAMHPEETEAWLLKGKILLADNKANEARKTFLHVLKLDQDNVQALNNIAWLLREDDTITARKYAEQALKLSPGYVTRDTLGTILLTLGENEKAEQLLREAFGEQPKSAEIRFHLAQALLGLNQTTEAKSLLKEVLRSKQTFPERTQAENLLHQLVTKE